MMVARVIAILIGVGAVYVLSTLVLSPRIDESLDARLGPLVEIRSPPDTKTICGHGKQELQAGDIIRDFDSLTYHGYLIQTRYRMAKLDVPTEYQPPPKPVKVSYVVVRHKRRIIARFDADIYSPLGNSTEAGLFSLLNNKDDQLVISQDISRTGVQWIADFSNGFKIIFDGQRFNVGREAYDMTISDLDGDGVSEITVPITAFYGFEGWRLSTSDTPLPDIIFKYHPDRREYLPANPIFKKCLLKNIEVAQQNIRSMNQQRSLGSLMAVVLDYVLVGEEQSAWNFFDEACQLPDKAKIKADMQKELKAHPVYRYIYKKRASR